MRPSLAGAGGRSEEPPAGVGDGRRLRDGGRPGEPDVEVADLELELVEPRLGEGRGQQVDGGQDRVGDRSCAVVPSEDERGVLAAEAEAVAHGDLHLDLAGLVRDVVEVALGVGVLEVDRRAE